MTPHYTDEELVNSFEADPSVPLPHLETCSACSTRAENVRGVLAAMDAWNIEDHDALLTHLQAWEPAETDVAAFSPPPPVDLSHQIYSLLEQICPIDIDILGPSVALEISQGRPAREFVRGGGGGFQAMSDVLGDVIATAGMVRAMLTLRQRLQAMAQEGGTAIEIRTARTEQLAQIASEFHQAPDDARVAAERLIFVD